VSRHKSGNGIEEEAVAEFRHTACSVAPRALRRRFRSTYQLTYADGTAKHEFNTIAPIGHPADAFNDL
jgi:hypothetical protein